MIKDQNFYFCGLGGSGMLSLAMLIRGMGGHVEGSDRAHDQGRDAPKFDRLRELGMVLHPQDGSGVVSADQTVVCSAAIEETVPDVIAARQAGATLTTRSQLLAQLFNAAKLRVGIAGTSGKSTTTGMVGYILEQAGQDPTIMNGADMKNFVGAVSHGSSHSRHSYASAKLGKGAAFVSELDESDGSIAQFTPDIAVINNIALDHKPMVELRGLFSDFANKARTVVLNLDNEETAAMARDLPRETILTFSLNDATADLYASGLEFLSNGVKASLHIKGVILPLHLQVPGRHNVSNALAAIAAAIACGVAPDVAVTALNGFQGIRRRLDVVGTVDGICVIDDFAHNPDKISATLDTLHVFPGRLLIMFQPHGFGPLRQLREAFVDCFVGKLRDNDMLLMPEPVYFGGTVNRSVGSFDIVADIVARGGNALALSDRESCGQQLLALARTGDRIVIMGARDDSLSQFAAQMLAGLAEAI